jgi:hypothetical protein
MASIRLGAATRGDGLKRSIILWSPLPSRLGAA